MPENTVNVKANALWDLIGPYPSLSHYDVILAALGAVVLRVDDRDEHDAFVLLRRGNRFGFLALGWGSCSFCDALQGVGSADELAALFDTLEHYIVWREGAGDLLEYLAQSERRFAWYGLNAAFAAFVQAASAALAETSAPKTLRFSRET